MSTLARQLTILCNVIMRVVSHHLYHILLEERHSSHPYPRTLHNGGIPGGRDQGGYLRVGLPWCLRLRKCFSVVASLFWKHLYKTTSYPVGQDDREATREAIDETGALSQGRNMLSWKPIIKKELVHSVLF